ncbi:MAG: hypothetical protein ACJ779_02035 [Chloroflexota bacterium]
MSDQPRRAPFSRLDPINWPAGTGIALFIAWAAFAVVTGLWATVLLCTVLPAGLALFLIAERYPWRVVLLLVVPLAILTIVAQVLATWPVAPTWLAFAIYVLACGIFSFVLLAPDRDEWVARLPVWFLGEAFDARLAWPRFEHSLVAANASVRQLDAVETDSEPERVIDRLAEEARVAARRGGIWQDAWAALATWLEELHEVARPTPAPDQARRIHELLADLDGAHMLALERTGAIDPGG